MFVQATHYNTHTFKAKESLLDAVLGALLALITSGFVSATLLPGNSEIGFIWFLNTYPNLWFWAYLSVSIANTAGSLVSYAMGRALPHKQKNNKVLALLQKYGTFILFFSWLPFIGDALPLGAGWLRLSFLRSAFWIFIGKTTRYGLLLLGFWAII